MKYYSSAVTHEVKTRLNHLTLHLFMLAYKKAASGKTFSPNHTRSSYRKYRNILDLFCETIAAY